jgi:hypothetical protein
MRNLTSIESATSILADLEFHLRFSDQSTTWIFNRNDIVDLTGLSWEVPFGGGLGRPSNYRITLSSSMGFIQNYFSQIIRSEGFLKVYVNSDSFTPHVGRIRDIKRNADNPGIFELQIYDSFLDGDPKIPVEAIVDSYSIVHNEVITSDMGYPLYYGKHLRPFYLTPVDCDISTLLGPRNVSSASHVTSLWFSSEIEKGYNISDKHTVALNKTWDQQSGGTNTASGGYAFEVHDPECMDVRLWEYDNTIRKTILTSRTQFSEGAISVSNQGYIEVYASANSWAFNAFDYHITPKLKKRIGSEVDRTTRINFSLVGSNVNIEYSIVAFCMDSGDGVYRVQHETTSATHISCTNIATIPLKDAFTTNQTVFFDNYFVGSHTGGVTGTMSCQMAFSLVSNEYKNYSMYGSQVNCGDIAISENPYNILKDIIDQTSFNYVPSLMNSAAFLTNSYNFQCFLGEMDR